jgi:hypothetical protein
LRSTPRSQPDHSIRAGLLVCDRLRADGIDAGDRQSIRCAI